MTVPLSILDLAPISEGCDAATALRNTVDLAQHAEQWGYKRYWIAEHHFVAVAASQPAVLIGQIAAASNTIRVGAAAVQLGQTTAIAVVESFGMLEAFHPGASTWVWDGPASDDGMPTSLAHRDHCRARNGATSGASSCRRRST